MSRAITIQDVRGRTIICPASSTMGYLQVKARDFLIACDIRNSTRKTFGCSEYSSEAIQQANAERAGRFVVLTPIGNDTYVAQWGN